MQLLGWEVDNINTVQFSNHTGYGRWQGQKFTGHDIGVLYQGLKDNHLDQYRCLLTGYVPGIEPLEAVYTIAEDLKKKYGDELIFGNENLFCYFLTLVVADPVMGDDEKLYVAEEVVPKYKELMHIADCHAP